MARWLRPPVTLRYPRINAKETAPPGPLMRGRRRRFGWGGHSGKSPCTETPDKFPDWPHPSSQRKQRAGTTVEQGVWLFKFSTYTEKNKWHLILSAIQLKVGEEGPHKNVPAPQDALGPPWWLSWQRTCLQRRRPGFNPCVGKIPWRGNWQPTPVSSPGKSMDTRAWRATVHGLTRVGHDSVTKPPDALREKKRKL